MSEHQPIKKVFILAGGQGTRLSEHTALTPKPLVPIGGDPVILHVMRRFYAAGIREFYLLVGYRSNDFKCFFRDYMFNKRDVVFTKYGSQTMDCDDIEDRKVSVIETGENATTGQRVNHIRRFLEPGEPFFLTYGDSVSNVDVRAIEALHFGQPEGNVLTVTAVPVKERFGILKVNGDNKVVNFAEKSDSEEQLINGGYIACNYKLLDMVNESTGDLSFEVLTRIAREDGMSFYHHTGFWHAMDTKRDVDELNQLYVTNPELFAK